ncbi:phenoloxidase-activating factor 2-like [Polyergus mexicanus]|uniref:phenoloxidase-activating factor 2-like n=1 Tax=Polyergus mexicanus TaxID=615972 RepID=UPI0038B5062C
MNSILFLLLLCQLLQQICGQMFFETTSMIKPVIVNNGQCLCYPGTTCPPAGIDIRIVNTGTTCPLGQVYCCTTPTNNVDCGTRKISSTSHPPGQAAYGAYPWQVAILTVGNVYVGGGVLISSMYVLTAAHKVQDYENNPGGIKAKLGTRDYQSTTEPSVDISISKVILHPQYNRPNCNLGCTKQNLPYDIAVLRLSSAAPIATSPNINTACLPNGPVNAATKCWVSGWGKNAFGPNGMYPNILREVDVPVLTHEDCQTALRKTRLGENFVLDSNSMCAGGEAGKDACTGDGGSPMVCPTQNGAFEVIGLVIWGIGCADAGIPGVYTNVYNYLPWIRQQMT